VDLGGEFVAAAPVLDGQPDDADFDDDEDHGGEAEDDEVEVADIFALFAGGGGREGLGAGDAGAQQQQPGDQGEDGAESPAESEAPLWILLWGQRAVARLGGRGIRHGQGVRRV
jgi:hypothetical protein